MLKRKKDTDRGRMRRPAAFLLAIALAVVAVSVTLDAYDRLPGLGEPGLAAAVSGQAPAALSLPTEPPHRMQVNHEIVRLVDRDAVLDFYAAYTGDRDVARVILDAALRAEVPVNLAFALGWQESRFDTNAVSGINYYGTRDWGLFQLNDAARPEWRRADFFDIRRNAESAMQYLRLCLGEMGSVDMALAAYNAGIRGRARVGHPGVDPRLHARHRGVRAGARPRVRGAILGRGLSRSPARRLPRTARSRALIEATALACSRVPRAATPHGRMLAGVEESFLEPLALGRHEPQPQFLLAPAFT